MNVVIARPQQQGAKFPQRNPYVMDVDRRENRNCYTYGGFEHLARYCRNRGAEINRRIEVEQDNNSNLNGGGGLGSPNYISVTITDLQCSLE